jgi:hypothetical protein
MKLAARKSRLNITAETCHREKYAEIPERRSEPLSLEQTLSSADSPQAHALGKRNFRWQT